MRRRPADPERTRSVLLICAALAFVLAVVMAAAALVQPVGDLVFGESMTGVFSSPVPTLLMAVVLVALGVGCLRLAGDDGRGIWCSACVARNPEDATTCEHCGARLG